MIRKGILHSIDWNRLSINAFEANNGSTAYDMMCKEKYDIVLLDIKMPGLSGLELIDKLRNSFTSLDTVFIILSGYAEFSFAKQAMKYGVKHYLLKPAAEEEIVSTLEKIILELKEKNISHEKLLSLINKIASFVRDCKLQEAKDEMKELFLILKECKVKQTCVNYCMELFVLIIRQCEDYQQISKYLKRCSEFDLNTSIRDMYNLILQTVMEINDINEIVRSRKYSKSVRLSLDYISENISNEELTLSHISNQLFMNSDYFGKVFKKEMKENFNDYLSKLRIKKAQEIIGDNANDKIGEIAEKVGFGSNSQYFSQVFKKYTGYTPKEYKAVLVKGNLQ